MTHHPGSRLATAPPPVQPPVGPVGYNQKKAKRKRGGGRWPDGNPGWALGGLTLEPKHKAARSYARCWKTRTTRNVRNTELTIPIKKKTTRSSSGICASA